MNRLMIIAAISAAPVLAQTAGDSKPAPSNVRGSEYPRIHSDLRATFHLHAREAQEVQVNVGGSKYDTTRDAEENWTGTSKPLVPGFHYYSLIVDCVAIQQSGQREVLRRQPALFELHA